MTDDPTLMARETDEIPAVAARLLGGGRPAIAAIVQRLHAQPVRLIATCARGSSDHAATYGKYLVETMLGVPVVSIAPSVASLFASPVATDDALCIAISQSGRSPDLLATVAAWQAADVPVAALVNDEGSPLSARADLLVPLTAGLERSVAATKSCVAAMIAFAALVADWSEDTALVEAVAALPDQLAAALASDWSEAVTTLGAARQMFVIGRGYGFAVAQEAALKLKETCAIQAEPFSAAEVRHGPMTIVGPGFPILALATDDAAGDDVAGAARDFAARGAITLLAATSRDAALPVIEAHPATQPILILAAFYRMVEQLARKRGLDPDRPAHLNKVTQTR